MSGVDNRVVKATFDNAQFEQGIKTTLSSLTKLNQGLKLEGASKGLSEVANASKNFSLQGIASGVQQLTSRFSNMSVVALTALTNIVNKAVNAGTQLVRSLSVDPVIAGLHEYETNLNSIQTILSNTQWENVGLKQVNSALAELNTYSDQTIYNFSEMARNIGTFTAAGVKLDVSVAAIKGIANLAAVSGSNAEQASTAMYQLSQALATGRVALMDWNSIVNAGMGGKVFQDSLKETARAHGVAIDDIIKKQGSFRDSLQKGWLTSQILTETLSKFTGDLSEKQLKSMGYSKQQIADIMKLGQTAKNAATQVKTVSQLIGTLQEAAGSGWAQTWQLIFGDFGEAKDMFTQVNTTLSGFISASAEARNKVLGDWKALGGRTALIEAIKNTFNALLSVVRPIKDAFREIFPATTGKQLYGMTVALRDFTKSLKIGGSTANDLKRTFAGVFAIFGILNEIIKQVVRTLFSLFDGADKGSKSFLGVTAQVGDFLVKLHEAIKNGDDLTQFFDKVGSVLKVPIHLLGLFVGVLSDMVKGASDLDTTGVAKFVGRFESFGKLGDVIANVWARVLGALSGVKTAFAPLAKIMSDFFSGLGQEITNSVGTIDYNSMLDTVNTGLLGGLLLILRKFLKGGVGLDFGGGFMSSAKDSLDMLTGTLKAMQTQIKANTLLKIAGALSLLTLSVVALSMIDSAKLTSALTAMAVMFTQLLLSMTVFEKIGATKGFLKMPFVTAAMILLAIAIDLLSIAVAKLAGLDWQGLAKGLIGVIALIGSLSVAAKMISGNSAGMIAAGAGLILLAGAIRILVGAVKDMSDMNWESLTKGLIGVAGLLGSLALFTKFAAVSKGGVLQGAGIILLAVGIKILASAMQDLSGMSWEGIAKGLVSMAGALILIGAALIAIPPTSILSAAAVFVVAASLGMIGDALGKMGGMNWENIAKGLVALGGALTVVALAIGILPPTSLLSAAAVFVVAASLGMIAEALGTMGGMSWTEIAKGLVALAGSLAIIAIAMAAMTSALPGAAALLVVAASLRILAPVLDAFGNMSLSEIGKSLLMLAGVFVVLGVAGLVLGPLVPVLLGLGAAITLIGIGVLAAGAGVLAFSVGLTALSIAGAAGTAAIVAMVSAILGLIPLAMKELGLGIIAFAAVIAQGGPAITQALVTVLMSLLTAIVTLSPKIVSTMSMLLTLLLNAMLSAIPQMVTAGMRIISGVLQGIGNNIGRVVALATRLIVNFLNAIGAAIPRVTQAGVNLILSFINGVANAIRNNSDAMGRAGANLAMAMVEGMVRGLGAGASAITDKARSVAKSALDAAAHALGINSPSKEFYALGESSGEGMINGLDSMAGAVGKSSAAVGTQAILAMRKTISGMAALVGSGVDLTPTITPVLDLTSFKRDAHLVGDMLTVKPINIATTTTNARAVSAGQMFNSSETASLSDRQASVTKTISFVQHNTSPKALTEIEIYRQTKNQISIAKGALANL